MKNLKNYCFGTSKVWTRYTQYYQMVVADNDFVDPDAVDSDHYDANIVMIQMILKMMMQMV